MRTATQEMATARAAVLHQAQLSTNTLVILTLARTVELVSVYLKAIPSGASASHILQVPILQ